mmetsp:Transcript_25610/g.71556  ORF Transcript_25610/g.71556 Transcript_25610/m.71556 type:complete len:466 (-) Transcript_25610:117-1514(-)|eukprot:CAMPEP_0119563528 /NCGR_PEP_ID=MMETSP1352-20130426/23723_1 /TAXON_ID=265584 /ORGANISM="Stauroneis constricta, Strain CCMP1120" /LENGTH=465 /DNA_ID=CAMNT_0007612147 /DNA_START=469 /DNA_END=1866 /DNA_ORIENTATION=+
MADIGNQPDLMPYANRLVLLSQQIRQATDAMQQCDFRFASQSLIFSLRLAQSAVSNLHQLRMMAAAADHRHDLRGQAIDVSTVPSMIQLERCPLGLSTSISTVWFVYKDARRIRSLPRGVLTRPDIDTLHSCFHVITGVLTYNIAALYHIKAFDPPTLQQRQRQQQRQQTQLEMRRHNMERAHVLYTKAIVLYAGCPLEDRVHDLSRLVGIWNNLAHINQYMENATRTHRFCHHMLSVLTSTTMKDVMDVMNGATNHADGTATANTPRAAAAAAVATRRRRNIDHDDDNDRDEQEQDVARPPPGDGAPPPMNDDAEDNADDRDQQDGGRQDVEMDQNDSNESDHSNAEDNRHNDDDDDDDTDESFDHHNIHHNMIQPQQQEARRNVPHVIEDDDGHHDDGSNNNNQRGQNDGDVDMAGNNASQQRTTTRRSRLLRELLSDQDWQLFSDHVSFLIGMDFGKIAAAA